MVGSMVYLLGAVALYYFVLQDSFNYILKTDDALRDKRHLFYRN